MNLKNLKLKKVYNSYKKNISKLLSPQMSNCKSDNQNPQVENLESAFECNICLDTAKNAVISMCGHLFCWPCLHQWLETKPTYQLCPVCKAAISKQKVIPLYGRGSSNEDPREKLPPRPKAQRSEPEYNNFFGQSFPSSFNFDISNLQVAFGIGAFPFAILASTFNFIDNRPPINPQDNLEERTLNKTFLLLAFFFIFWLLVA